MLETIINAITPIFVVLGLGYFCGLRKIADNKNVAVLNVFVMRFALPAALFTATWNAPITDILSKSSLIITLVLVMWIVWGLAYKIARMAFHKEPAPASVYALTISLPNYAALTFPILNAVYPGSADTGLIVAVSIACGSIFLSPLTLILLEEESVKTAEQGHPSSTLEPQQAKLRKILPFLFKALKNPIVLWPIIGTLLSLTGSDMPDLLNHALKPLAIAGGGGALFLTGLILSARRLKITSAVLFGFLVKNFAQPLGAYALALALGFDAKTVVVSVLLSALATGFFGVMFGNGYGVQDADSEGALLLSTVLFAFTIPLFLYLTI